MAILCKITNYISFNILRKLTSYLNTTDEFDGGKGKQVHEHSHKKKKHIQDFKYLNLQNNCMSFCKLKLYLIREQCTKSSFFLTKIILHQRPSNPFLENKGTAYTKLRGLTTSWITTKANKLQCYISGNFNTCTMTNKITL